MTRILAFLARGVQRAVLTGWDIDHGFNVAQRGGFYL